MCGHVMCLSVTGTFTTNTDSMAMIILGSSDTAIKIKKVRVTTDDGTATTTPDYHKRIRLGLTSNTTAGTSATPINVDRGRNWFWTGARKGPATSVTLSSTLETFSVHSATDFAWQAADDDDKIVLPAGTTDNFIVEINPAGD